MFSFLATDTNIFNILRLRFSQVVTCLIILVTSVTMLVELSDAPQLGSLINSAVPLGLAVVCLVMLVRHEYVETITETLTVVIALATFIAPSDLLGFMGGAIAMYAAALLCRYQVYLGCIALFIGHDIYRIMQLDSGGSLFNSLPGYLLIGAVAIIFSVVVLYFSQNVQRIVTTSNRRADLLRATSEIGQITASLLDLNALFNRTVDLIRERFGVYHVQVFLVDEAREYAVLKASTGDIGKRLLQRGHRLTVGSQSVIGRVTQLGDVIVARDTEGDAIHARNELLPATRSELALPIVEGERIIGALDVQSTRADAFDEMDIQALQVMASQLATATRNGRLFEAQASNLQENKRLFLESEASLREIQRLNRQLTRNAWEGYLRDNRDSTGVMLTRDGQHANPEWTPEMVEAAQTRRPVRQSTQRRGSKQIMAVPIILRGEVLGAIEIAPGEDMQESDTIEMMQSVAQRLAISLDNARLFEETQQATVQQQRINEIVSRYQSAVSIDELLQITLAELSTSLGADGGAIRLSLLKPPADDNEAMQADSHNGHYQNGGAGS